jgi:hypothetical protein
MDESLESILDSLPPKPSRSKLEPYREFICELRMRGRSYQEITHILRDRCGVTAGVNSVYNFVRVREKAEKRTRPRQHNGASRSSAAAVATGPVLPLPSIEQSQPIDDAWKNIEKLKQRRCARTTEEKVFVYNEDEPLKLVPWTGHDAARKNKA